MTEEERDQILLDLRDKVGRLEKGQASLLDYVRAMAGKLLSPSELAELEARASEAESVAAD